MFIVRNLWVKIEGLRRPAQAVRVAEMGADAIGLVFADSPRRVSVREARAVTDALPASAKSGMMLVGVFVNAEAEEINHVVGETGINCVQLHGDEPPEIIEKIDARCMKAFRIRSTGWAKEVQGWLDGLADINHLGGIVLDAYDSKARGGTGRRFNWHWAADAPRAERLDGWPAIILAGGLTPECVGEAIDTVQPWGVDVASGVESSPGVKDLRKVRSFMAAAVQEKPPPGQIAVIQCLRYRRLSRLAAYLRRYSQLKRQRPPGESVLHLCLNGRKSLLGWLLKQGVCPDQRNDCDSTVLMSVAAEGRLAMMETLLAHGADVNARNVTGETAFSYACACGGFEAARMLHEHGAEINTFDLHRATPLDWAKWGASKRFYDWLADIGGVHKSDKPGWVGSYAR